MKNIDLILLFVGFSVAYFSYKFYIPFAKEIGIVDLPIKRSTHKKPIPTTGGMVFFMISLIGSFFIYSFNPNNQIITFIPLISTLLVLISLSCIFKFLNSSAISAFNKFSLDKFPDIFKGIFSCRPSK